MKVNKILTNSLKTKTNNFFYQIKTKINKTHAKNLQGLANI